MSDYVSDMDRYYDERAPEYEQIYYRDGAARRKEIDDEVERVRKLAEGKRVLEIACGTGYWTQYLSQTALQVTAVDLSPKMIGEARKKTLVCPVEFVQADLNHLPSFLGTFDMVAVGFWFSHHPREDYQSLLRILDSHLSQHGILWLIDNNPPAEGPRQDFSHTDSHGNNYKKRYLSDGREFTIRKNYFSEEELRRIFGAQFRVNRLTFGCHYWAVVCDRYEKSVSRCIILC